MVKTHEDFSEGPGVHQLLLGTDLSFLKLVCSTKGFPGKGRSFLDPLKAGWGNSARLSCSVLQFTALLSKFSVYLLFDGGKLLNINSGQLCGIQICRRVHLMDILYSIFLPILLANGFD